MNTNSNHKYTNFLIDENSPYLLQHAHNPVNWYPYSDEAFELARSLDRPIFLSIGYSTCHWCHVMEQESFENTKIAKILNDNFISIKVDRETRPDIDAIYMNAVQALTGAGGWPLSVFLIPEGKPFFGGTYFPPNDMFGKPGFYKVLTQISKAWKSSRRDLLESAQNLTNYLNKQTQSQVSQIDETTLTTAFEILEQIYDNQNAGFGSAPKFPQPLILDFLFQHFHATKNSSALEMCITTLNAIERGGIHDHLGGGFHRYSTDAQWFAPHFEKMLYDQALLIQAYTTAYMLTYQNKHLRTIEHVFSFLQTEMTHPDGGFYSAMDADSEGVEGKFYTWTESLIDHNLPSLSADIFKARFGITAEGNFENGENILYVNKTYNHLAQQFKKTPDEIKQIIQDSKIKLLEIRNKRVRPSLDDKILTDWNALTIEALARAAKVLDNPDYLQAAQKAAHFIFDNLYQDGKLLHAYRNGKTHPQSFLEDYAFMINALIELYQADHNPDWLAKADSLAQTMLDNFSTDFNLLQQTPKYSSQLIAKNVPLYDGVTPSGNSAAAIALLKLSKFTYNNSYLNKALSIIQNASADIKESPLSHLSMLCALNFYLGPSHEIVFVHSINADANNKFENILTPVYLPNAVTITITKENLNNLFAINDYLKNFTAIANNPTVYICTDFSCKSPIYDPVTLQQQLQTMK